MGKSGKGEEAGVSAGLADRRDQDAFLRIRETEHIAIGDAGWPDPAEPGRLGSAVLSQP